MRILIVSHGVLNNNSGLGRVHYELKQEYEKAGHTVDKVDYSDLYPKGQNKFQKIFYTSFTEQLFKYLQKHAHQYDVIDANFENIVYPKEAFGFKGLLFVRSHGIRPLYIAATKIEGYAKALKEEGEKKKTVRNRIGSYLRSFYKDLTLGDFHASLNYADIVHCLNSSEYEFFINLGIAKDKLVFIPNALPKAFLEGLYLNPSLRKNNQANISFVGSWGFVKGIKDWRKIANLTTKKNKVQDIYIIGSMMSEDFVKKDFDPDVHNSLKIIPAFKADQLSDLLKKAKIGIFPSYMEGFGYAVLEQLAAGIPVVAYKVPGVADMLNQVDPTLLVEPGNTESLADKAIDVLNMNDNVYEILSNKCIEISKNYILENIAPIYLETFEKSLKVLHDRL